LTIPELNSINDWADFWRFDIGVNVIPADTRRKVTYESWGEWQNKPIPDGLYSEWKSSGAFDKGIAVILGKVWHNPRKTDLYLIGIDLDNQKAIEEVCNRNDRTITLSQLSQWTLVEQHQDDPTKAHVLLYARRPFPKKSSDNHTDISGKLDSNEIPAIEVKGLGSHGILFVSPSIHQNGNSYQILGTLEPVIADDFVNHLDDICRKYSIPYLEAADTGNGKSLLPIQDLFKPDFTILEGHNRHEGIMRIMESLIARLSGILSLEEIKSLAYQWNLKHCNPPLDNKEFEKQWECATDYIAKKGPKPDEEDDKGIRSAADLLVRLAIENTSLLFKDQYGAAHAQLHVADHDEILRIESSKFKRHLARQFYEKNRNKVVNSESITNAIQVIQAKAEYEGNTIPLSIRVAWHDSSIYYDLSNDKWQCIKISSQDWELSNTTYPLFVRFNQTSQAEPDRRYDSDILDRFLRLTNLKQDQDRILLKVYIISLFIPDIPHAMLILHGEKGSAKSTLQTLIKLLVDPGKPTLLTVHNDRTEFVQQLAHNHIAYYDNVKQTPGWLSDEACKAVTGIGQTKRKLYSDDEDIVYEYKRCLGFNGVNNSLTEPDALDRSLMIELDRISKENRKVESDIMADFMQLRPQLLGYIFDILVKALQIKSTIKLNDLPRMADFAIWGEAIARAMGYKDLEFINAYYENIGKQNIEAIENHPLGQTVAKFFEEDIQAKSKMSWEGQPAKLLEELEIVAQRHKVNTNHKSWPKEVRWLTRRLNQIRSNLLEGLGIEVQINRLTDISKGRSKANTSSIVIRKMTPMTPMTPIVQNHEGNNSKLLETFSRLDTNNSNVKNDSNQKAENHAQNTEIGDIGQIGDILSIEGGGGSFLFECYHRDCDYRTNDEKDYHIHAAQKHTGIPVLYPTKAELEKYGLQAQGKDWEI
jgi:Bifunctional DNA primase/polymerase, N-terminal